MLGADLIWGLKGSHRLFGLGLGPNPHTDIPFEELDITDREAVGALAERIRPDVIIHAAAYRDADQCEREPEQAYAVNCKGTEWVARAAGSVGAKLFFISSDYVFDGTKRAPYTEEDPPNPLSVYGRNKAESEEFLKSWSRSAWIIRTSWLFGTHGRSFFRSILNAVKLGRPLRVVNDQRGAPTYARDLADAFRVLIEKAQHGTGGKVYHLTNGGTVTWYEAACRLLAKLHYQGPLEAISSEELNWPARRPKNSALSMDRIRKDFGICMRPWDEAFNEYWDTTLVHEWTRPRSSSRIKKQNQEPERTGSDYWLGVCGPAFGLCVCEKRVSRDGLGVRSSAGQPHCRGTVVYPGRSPFGDLVTGQAGTFFSDDFAWCAAGCGCHFDLCSDSAQQASGSGPFLYGSGGQLHCPTRTAGAVGDP